MLSLKCSRSRAERGSGGGVKPARQNIGVWLADTFDRKMLWVVALLQQEAPPPHRHAAGERSQEQRFERKRRKLWILLINWIN